MLSARSVDRIVDMPARTRERLLDAAEKLFAARGFRATSVRDITAEAACNVAAVNYHFGSKVNLYREMFRRRLGALREHRIASIHRAMTRAGERADLELLLRAFTTAFLEPHLDESRGRVLMQLLSHEILDPHLRPGTFESEMVGPVREALSRAMRAAVRGLGVRAARRCFHSIVALLVHVVQMRSMPGAAGGPAATDFAFPGVVDHIVRFSAAGVRACRGAAEAGDTGPRPVRRA
jgi:AcrR family transcriptional regulator